jgi:hypothetical protein
VLSLTVALLSLTVALRTGDRAAVVGPVSVDRVGRVARFPQPYAAGQRMSVSPA